MTAGSREVVASRRSELAASMVRRIEAEPGADLAWEAAQLDALDKLLGAISRPGRAMVAARLGAHGGRRPLCRRAGDGWTLRVDRLGVRTGVVLDANAQAVVVTFAAPWELDEPIPLAGGVRLLEADLDVVGAPSALDTSREAGYVDGRSCRRRKYPCRFVDRAHGRRRHDTDRGACRDRARPGSRSPARRPVN